MNRSLGSMTIIFIFAIAIWEVGATNPASAQCQANELAKLIASDAAPLDKFGQSVSIDGDVLVVGASWDDDAGSDSGSTYVYRFDGTNWVEEAKLTASDAAPLDLFGSRVSISGDVALIGAYYDNDAGLDSGSAYVFRYDSKTGIWKQEAKLTASDAAENDHFGFSVSVEGDVALIGARSDDDAGSNSGSAYVFRFDGSTWFEAVKLTASDAAASDAYGGAVSVSGDVAVIGASGDDDACLGEPWGACGSAYIYRFDPELGWIEEAKLTASDAQARDWFGGSVSITGDVAVIGASNEGNSGQKTEADGTGAAYVFRFDGSTWNEEAKLTASDGAAYHVFGGSVAIRDDFAVIGAYLEGKEFAGSAYVFRVDPQTSQWIEEAKLIASDAESFDWFGISVSMSSDAVVIGASRGHARGVQLSGSAYVFGGLSDCNDNGTLDICDIADGTSQDTNVNGIPDECECPWDLDDNGVVGVPDLLSMLASWGPCKACPADFDGNGNVGVSDLLVMLANWGPCP